MQEDHYLVPDYYPDFNCKQGACRTPCCEGWPISLSMQDYFRLVSAPCSMELRRKLDGGMRLSSNPSPEHYAQISPRYDGKCPMHMADGRCMLHAELGGEALAMVCRLYPRGMRTGENKESSCANSCEAVVELLLNRQEPLKFASMPLECPLPPAPPPANRFYTAGRGQEIRLWLIGFVQQRELPLARRMLRLGVALRMVEAALEAQDDARLEALLSGQEEIAAPPMPEAGHDQLLAGLICAEEMLAVIDRFSPSVHGYGEAALAHFGSGEEAYGRYQAATEGLAALIPQWEIWFEHMLVNHMFFAQFPFQDRPMPLKDEYLALCAVYVLVRFLMLGWTAEHPTEEAAVDVCAAAFRLVAHTDFDRLAAPIMRDLGCSEREPLQALLCL